MKITTRPGTKFPGDRAVLVDGVPIKMRSWAYVCRLMVHNDRLRMKNDPTRNWKEEPLDFYVKFLREYVNAPDDLAAAEVARRYKL